MGEKITESILSEFSIDNSGMAFFHQVKSLGRLLNGVRAKHHQKCEIFLVGNKFIFRMKGSEFTIDCSTSKNVKIELYYTDLKEALQNDRSSELSIRVHERNFIINERKLICKAKVEISDDFMLDAGLTALNFEQMNVATPSWQKQEYTLKSNGERIHMDTLRRDAEKAALLLKKYKVDSNKIVHLIMESMV